MGKGSYIYESREWVLTGREARKTGRLNTKMVMVEIKPIDAPEEDNSYNVWVNMDDLYHVVQD